MIGFIDIPTGAWVSQMQVSSWANVVLEYNQCTCGIYGTAMLLYHRDKSHLQYTHICSKVFLYLLCICLSKKMYAGQEKGVCVPKGRGFFEVEKSKGLGSLEGKERELE